MPPNVRNKPPEEHVALPTGQLSALPCVGCVTLWHDGVYSTVKTEKKDRLKALACDCTVAGSTNRATACVKCSSGNSKCIRFVAKYEGVLSKLVAERAKYLRKVEIGEASDPGTVHRARVEAMADQILRARALDKAQEDLVAAAGPLGAVVRDAAASVTAAIHDLCSIMAHRANVEFVTPGVTIVESEVADWVAACLDTISGGMEHPRWGQAALLTGADASEETDEEPVGP